MKAFRIALRDGNIVEALCVHAPFGWTSRCHSASSYEFRVDTGYHKDKYGFGPSLLAAVRKAFPPAQHGEQP